MGAVERFRAGMRFRYTWPFFVGAVLVLTGCASASTGAPAAAPTGPGEQDACVSQVRKMDWHGTKVRISEVGSQHKGANLWNVAGAVTEIGEYPVEVRHLFACTVEYKDGAYVVLDLFAD